jgi:hypothetical protein
MHDEVCAPQVQALEVERDELAAANAALQRSIEGDLLQQQVPDLPSATQASQLLRWWLPRHDSDAAACNA